MDFLVVLPDVVGKAELVDGVEVGEKGGCKIFVLRGCCPVVGIGKHGEDDLEGVVALFFERQKKPLDALLRCRYHILIADNAEAVRRKDKVELWHSVQHRLSAVMIRQ